ncbi:MAG: immunoglobulin domain-containing protein, partial [Bacteroidales bacterium]|nr:immunoglobulin domain-containing protein [Bacteroidales bacterium]
MMKTKTLCKDSTSSLVSDAVLKETKNVPSFLLNVQRTFILGLICLITVIIPQLSYSQSQIKLKGYRINQGGNGLWSTSYTTGNLGNYWEEGEWVPYKITLTGLTQNFTNFDSVRVSFDFTNSQGYRFIDLVKGIQVGRMDLTDADAFPDPNGFALPLSTMSEIEFAQNDLANNKWANYEFVPLPQNQINTPVGGDGTVTALRRSFLITRQDLINSGINTDAGDAHIYFRLHFSRTFFWSRSLQSNYSPIYDEFGGYVYNDPLNPLFSTDSRLGSSYVSGSSGHVALDNYGNKTVPIPIPEKLYGEISGVKFQDNNGNGIWDSLTEPTISNFPICLSFKEEGLDILVVEYTDINGAYSFTDIPYTDWHIFECNDPAFSNYTQTYPNAMAAPIPFATPIMKDPAYVDITKVRDWGWYVLTSIINPVVTDVNFGNVDCIPVTIDPIPDIAVCEGDDITITANLSGTQPYTISWTYNGVPILGATASTLVITNAQPAQSGTYCILATNACGNATECLDVLVNYTPPPVVTDVYYCLGDQSVPLTAQGTNLIWYDDQMTQLSGAPTPSTGVTGTYTYYVTSTDNGCESTPAQIDVIVYPLPICSIDGDNGPVCPSLSLTYTAPVSMSTYQWSISGNGTISSGGNSQTVTVTTGTNCNASFTLTLTITDGNGCSAVCSKNVLVEDITAPVFNTPPADITVECSA